VLVAVVVVVVAMVVVVVVALVVPLMEVGCVGMRLAAPTRRCNLEVLNNSREQMAKFELSGRALPYGGPALFLRGLKSNYVSPERHGW
jgi:hypothetical protein